MNVEERTREIGRQIFASVSKQKRGFFHGDLDSKIMDWTMKDEKLKVQMFRFVDVLPMLKTPDEIMRHLQEYLKNFPAVGQWGINFAASSGLVSGLVSGQVKNRLKAWARSLSQAQTSARLPK